MQLHGKLCDKFPILLRNSMLTQIRIFRYGRSTGQRIWGQIRACFFCPDGKAGGRFIARCQAHLFQQPQQILISANHSSICVSGCKDCCSFFPDSISPAMQILPDATRQQNRYCKHCQDQQQSPEKGSRAGVVSLCAGRTVGCAGLGMHRYSCGNMRRGLGGCGGCGCSL